MSALDILEAAAGHMKDRAATYDKPAGERSMGATVAAFKAITGISMTEEQGWLFMGVLKQVRTQQGGWRADNYEDGAAYFALQGEAAERDRGRAAGEAFDEQRMDAIGQNGNDGLHYSEDMTDPRNWRAGDWVECTKARSPIFMDGAIYPLAKALTRSGLMVSTGGGEGQVLDRALSEFRFHARPDADGWIKHESWHCPVSPDVMVDVRGHDKDAWTHRACDLDWSRGIDNPIAYYRPHLATNQNND